MSFKRCPKCGEDNPGNVFTCIICGASLKDAAIIETASGPIEKISAVQNVGKR